MECRGVGGRLAPMDCSLWMGEEVAENKAPEPAATHDVAGALFVCGGALVVASLGVGLGSLAGPGGTAAGAILGTGVGAAFGEFVNEWQQEGLDHLHPEKIVSVGVAGAAVMAATISAYAFAPEIVTAFGVPQSSVAGKVLTHLVGAGLTGVSLPPVTFLLD